MGGAVGVAYLKVVQFLVIEDTVIINITDLVSISAKLEGVQFVITHQKKLSTTCMCNSQDTCTYITLYTDTCNI